MSDRQENATVNGGTVDQDFTTGSSDSNPAVNETLVNLKFLDTCFNKMVDREMDNSVDTVENRIQNACLTAIDSIINHKTESVFRSTNASSGRDATSVLASSERGEHIGSVMGLFLH